MTGEIDGQHARGVEGRRLGREIMEGTKQQSGPREEQNDAVICVTAKVRSRRLEPVVLRPPPAASPEAGACAEGSRGM